MTIISEFFEGKITDSEGRYLVDMIQRDDDWLEDTHDYIQWWFPNPIPSNYNLNAPLLTAEDVEAIESSPNANTAYIFSFARMLVFFGYQSTGDDFERASNYEERKHVLCEAFNHNHLRFTRVLIFLKCVGRDDFAERLATKVMEDAQCENSKKYWSDAIKEEYAL